MTIKSFRRRSAAVCVLADHLATIRRQATCNEQRGERPNCISSLRPARRGINVKRQQSGGDHLHQRGDRRSKLFAAAAAASSFIVCTTCECAREREWCHASPRNTIMFISALVIRRLRPTGLMRARARALALARLCVRRRLPSHLRTKTC